jgi:hypothetical protein
MDSLKPADSVSELRSGNFAEPGSPEQPLSAGHPAGHRVPRGPRPGGVPLPRGDACAPAVTGTVQTMDQ